jgi:uncharacterized protein
MPFPLPPELPPEPGLGFKHAAFRRDPRARAPVGFFEIHAENYMGDGGPPHARLARLRARLRALDPRRRPLDRRHGPLDRDHLARLRALCDRYEPESFSEHLAWSTHDGAFLNDLLPLPYNEETLALVATMSTRCRRRSAGGCCSRTRRAISPSPTEHDETEFLRRDRAAHRLRAPPRRQQRLRLGGQPPDDALAYLDAFPLEHVGEIHLGGHDEDRCPRLAHRC